MNADLDEIYYDWTKKDARDAKLMSIATLAANTNKGWNVSSYGAFTLTDEQFYSGVSSPINKTLSDMFVSLRFSEQSGHGVPIIVKKYGREAFSFKSETVTVTIPFNYIPDFVVGRRIKEDQVDKLTPNQKSILYCIKEHPSITQVEIASNIQRSIQGVKKAIVRLQELDLLERIGSKKDGTWNVKVY